MAYTIHVTVEVDFQKNGHWQYLADILLLNGYTLEITKKEIVNQKLQIQVNTERFQSVKNCFEWVEIL